MVPSHSAGHQDVPGRKCWFLNECQYIPRSKCVHLLSLPTSLSSEHKKNWVPSRDHKYYPGATFPGMWFRVELTTKTFESVLSEVTDYANLWGCKKKQGYVFRKLGSIFFHKTYFPSFEGTKSYSKPILVSYINNEIWGLNLEMLVLVTKTSRMLNANLINFYFKWQSPSGLPGALIKLPLHIFE